MKSQSVSLSCCMKSWGSPVLSHWALNPASPSTLETMSLVVWFWKVRTLRGADEGVRPVVAAHQQLHAAGAEVELLARRPGP